MECELCDGMAEFIVDTEASDEVRAETGCLSVRRLLCNACAHSPEVNATLISSTSISSISAEVFRHG